MDLNSFIDQEGLRGIKSYTPDDLRCLRRLENTVTHLESFLEFPDQRPSLLSNFTRSSQIRYPSPVYDDTLSDVDLDKFDEGSVKNDSQDNIIDATDTALLSDLPNVRDVLLNIKERLDSYLKLNEETTQGNAIINKSNLEKNIADLKSELERYVHFINEKKENELRKFSENMTNQSNILQIKKAFSRKEKLNTHVYETLSPSHMQYALAYDSLPITKERVDGFTMRNCYDNNYIFETYSDFSPVEYYTMIINEENGEKLLDEAPPPPRYCNDRNGISFIFRDPEKIIKQWQNYQLKTLQKGKSFKFKWNKRQKPENTWGFTLDYHQNRVLQERLEKERRIR